MVLKRKYFATTCSLVSLIATGCAAPEVAPSGAGDEVQNVIVMVADGAGVEYWTAARLAADSLAVDAMPVGGLVDTRSTESHVTDSAAGATAYATGERSYNGAISVSVECLEMMRTDSVAVANDPASCAPMRNLFEVANEQGMATGLVTTTRITDATPAAFGAHAAERGMQAAIAEQLIANDIDVLLGAGRGLFDGTERDDGRDLLAGVCPEAACISTASELAAYSPDDRRLIGLFPREDLHAAATRQPSLPQMVATALQKLEMDPDGFVAMFESEGTDEVGHGNAPVGELIAEILQFDDAVGVALDYARNNPGTLLVVLADHETGGLAVGLEADTATAEYTTGGHTAAMVPLFAYGPGAERFGGMVANFEVGRLLQDALR
ncbi:MAG TPA: alkaline phosphatase [Longimicrobiaceae bacterium]|nr:alkaline phosphatase [Longimicrobiaceae bacterium]